MKSLGRVAYDAYTEEAIEPHETWIFLEQVERDAWEAAAEATVEAYEQRKPDEDNKV